MRHISWITIGVIASALVSCTSAPSRPSNDRVLTFQGAGGHTELGVDSVKSGVDRRIVEWSLLSDAVGEEELLNVLHEKLGLERIKSEDRLRQVLAEKFALISGQEKALALWHRYPVATYSMLECNNRIIVFFDAQGRSVAAWPELEDVKHQYDGLRAKASTIEKE